MTPTHPKASPHTSEAYPRVVLATRLWLALGLILLGTLRPVAGDGVEAEPWLMYRGMALDDLRLALGRIDLRLESLRNEVARSRKLVDAGAAPAVELMETQGSFAISAAERAELLGLIRWMTYLNELSNKDRAFSEVEHFTLFLGHLEPRVKLAESVTSLMAKRHSLNQRLQERRAIAAEEFERSADALSESQARQRFYTAQALAARYALEVRTGKRDYREEDAVTLAEAVRQTRVAIWKSALAGVDHRLARLLSLKARGVVYPAEIESAEETRKLLQKAMEEAQSAPPEPFPAPGRMKRPDIHLVDLRQRIESAGSNRPEKSPRERGSPSPSPPLAI